MKKAKEQIQDQRYTTELVDAGANPIHRLAIAFGGKEVRVEA